VDLLWVGARIVQLLGLIVYSVNVVASHSLAAILYGMSLIVFVLTAWELWAPAKAIADDLAARYL
jgi:hypothetical protein